MIRILDSSRQPQWDAWTMDRLINERSFSLSSSLDTSSFGTYTSALNSYLTFCNLHHLPVNPTPDTLSFYVVFLSSHINPKSVNSYLLGICQQLEPFFPDVHQNCKTVLVSRTMSGCMRWFGTPVKQKAPLSHADLELVLNKIRPSASHDNLLFRAQLLCGFHVLLQLGELVFPDKLILRNYHKISLCHTVHLLPDLFSFFLPSHKGDHTFEGNKIVIQKLGVSTDPYAPFMSYLTSRDPLFPLNPELWLTSCGVVPTHHWFISWLHTHLPTEYAGHSMRSGGATSLAEAGVDVSTIQAVGRWSSQAFQIYICKNPVIIHALLFGHAAHQPAD
jgi:hypothetical protein